MADTYFTELSLDDCFRIVIQDFPFHFTLPLGEGMEQIDNMLKNGGKRIVELNHANVSLPSTYNQCAWLFCYDPIFVRYSLFFKTEEEALMMKMKL